MCKHASRESTQNTREKVVGAIPPGDAPLHTHDFRSSMCFLSFSLRSKTSSPRLATNSPGRSHSQRAEHRRLKTIANLATVGSPQNPRKTCCVLLPRHQERRQRAADRNVAQGTSEHTTSGHDHRLSRDGKHAPKNARLRRVTLATNAIRRSCNVDSLASLEHTTNKPQSL